MFLSTPSHADTLTGHVIKIADGDTVTILDASNEKHRVRLAGIDAPERKQPFGKRSKQHLSSLVAGKPVVIEYDKRDRYGRIVGKILVATPGCATSCPMTYDTGLEQIRVGLAWWYEKYANEQSAEDQRLYSAAEKDARVARRGLWVDNGPMPPWEWRKRQR